MHLQVQYHYILTILLGLIVLVTTGCVSSQKRLSHIQELPEHFSASGDTPLVEDWWTVFNDTTLNRLVQEALTNSPDLQTSWYRFQQAEAAEGDARGAQYPELTARFSAEREEVDSETTDQLSLGLTASYEADLWGGFQAQAKAARLQSEATYFDLQAAAITLSASISSRWIALISNDAQLSLLRDQVNSNEQALSLLEKRFGRGAVSSVDVLRQRQLLAATRQQLHDVSAETDILRHQLAILLGRAPQNAPVSKNVTLPELPPLPESGFPMDLIRRRPDLLSAYTQVEAANRETAVAISQRFPRIALSASTTTLDNDMEKLFDDWATSLAGNIAAPLLDAGRRRAFVRQAEAREDELLHEYGQAVLNALGDVENALSGERHQSRSLEQLTLQLDAANRAHEQLQTQYLNGSSSFIDVLTSRIDTQRLQRDVLKARSRLLLTRIGLYRALAGAISLDLEEE